MMKKVKTKSRVTEKGDGVSGDVTSTSSKARELAAGDERFNSVFNNPIYRPVPKKEKKIDIDQRFQSMFHDKKFKLKYKTDKRGRPVDSTTDENLMKYYNLINDEEEVEVKEEIKSESEEEHSSSEEEQEEDSDLEGEIKESEIIKPLKTKLSANERKKLHDAEIDYARGEVDFISEESSDEDSSESDNEVQTVDHDWGELDKDASRTELSTKRLALCNMDWDRLKAADLMVLFTSFLPSGGLLKSIDIYPSEFGKERMAEEELKGPLELAQFKKENASVYENEDDESESDGENRDEDDDDEDEGASFQREKLRSYQLNRLKYFYAVLEFDSVESAEKVYTECDGMEYESSAAKIDLRFIPDDMEFNETPKDKCINLPDSNKYRPKFFTTTALQQVKVHCTWDETDPTRKDLIDKVYNPKEKVDDDDLKAYLASSSEESDSEQELSNQDKIVEGETDVNGKSSDPISKYRALLESIEETEKNKKRKDVELEITWGVGLKKKTEDLVKKKLDEKDNAGLTPWEELMLKKKQKKKLSKVAKKIAQEEESKSSGDEDDDDQPFSDDEVDIDMNDPFFKSEMDTNDVFKKSKNSTSKKPSNPKNNKEKAETKTDAELELLLMDENEGKKHFNLKKIIDNENDSKSKRKRKLKKEKKVKASGGGGTADDDFKVDVKDDRFSALFTSHHFNIDPSEPSFKRTKGMDIIVTEKHNRRLNSASDKDKIQQVNKLNQDSSSSNPKSNDNKNAELSYLVKSIKRNTKIQNIKNS